MNSWWSDILVFLEKITVAHVLLIGVVVCTTWFVRVTQKSKHAFDIRDTLMDPITKKASQYACIIWSMDIMAVWICVKRTLDGKDVDSLVLGVLSIFVLGKLGYQGIDAWKNKEPAGSPPATTTTTSKVETEKTVVKKETP